ncbi:MAG: hypothetical protein U0270_03165 [Labilithrix sp.]
MALLASSHAAADDDKPESDLPAGIRIGARVGLATVAGKVYRGGRRAPGDSSTTTPIRQSPSVANEVGTPGILLEIDVRLRIDAQWSVYLLAGHTRWALNEGDHFGIGARWVRPVARRSAWIIEAASVYEKTQLTPVLIADVDGGGTEPSPAEFYYTGPTLHVAAGPSWRVTRWLDLEVLASINAGTYLGCSANINPFVRARTTSGPLACTSLPGEDFSPALHGTFALVLGSWLR